MGLKGSTAFADRFNYRWHSNPSTPDAWTFFDKAVQRVQRDEAFKILRGETEGDTSWAEKILDQGAYYKDAMGSTQFTDNPNMVSGRAVQQYADRLLVDEVSPSDAYADAINLLHGFRGGDWRDTEKDARIIENRERLYYDAEGKRSKEPTHNEFGLVCENAAAGVREAMQGANRITGEIELFGPLPGCELPYFGKPDYGDGRCELKTQWDQAADTDSPRANSLPKKIKAPHMMQIAGYWYLSGIVTRIVYANRLGYVVHEPTEEELDRALGDIASACKRREKLMKVADDVQDLLRLTDPHFADSFVWRDVHPEVLMQAKKMFGVI